MADDLPDRSDLSLEALSRIDKACIDFERQWNTGKTPNIKTFVTIADQVERRQLIKELLILDLHYRQRNSKPLNKEDYARVFPEDVSLIQKTFQQNKTRSNSEAGRGESQNANLSHVQTNTDFADYEILEEIDRGGMGIVYKAEQKSLNRIVAIKMILHGHLANDEEVQRFRKEAKAAGALDHPGIVAVHEIGVHREQHYFSMAYVDGTNMETLTAGNPMPSRAAAILVLKIVEAMAFAHDHGVLHRDLKPSNILIDTTGEPRIMDFGLAKDMSTDTLLTQTGQILGTPAFMSPEQATGRVDLIGPSSDIYSIGAILNQVLTGHPPFKGNSPFETLRKVREVSPPKPRSFDKRISRELELICLKCLEKDPNQRYTDAHDLKDDLNRYLNGEAVRIASQKLFKRIGGQLRYQLDDEQFKDWGLAFYGTGICIFVAHLITAWLFLANVAPMISYWIPRAGEVGLLFVLLYIFQPQIFPRNPNERVLWGLFIGYLAATVFIAVTIHVRDGNLLDVYPYSSVCAAICFSVLGARYWGGNYWIVAAFFLIAPALHLFNEWAPAVYGFFWLSAASINGFKYWGGTKALQRANQRRGQFRS